MKDNKKLEKENKALKEGVLKIKQSVEEYKALLSETKKWTDTLISESKTKDEVIENLFLFIKANNLLQEYISKNSIPEFLLEKVNNNGLE